MSTSFTVHTFALAAGLACAAGAYAADTSTERTTMPDYCSQRDVNCVMPDNTTPIRSAVGATIPGSSGTTTPPPVTSTPTAPALRGTNQGLFGAGTSSTTSPTTSGSTGTTSSTTIPSATTGAAVR